MDPPITPAPVFAYRAIRGWFVGSPESPPERDNQILASPTKSILRTPGGQPTPRANSLRDVNVKFKSVSPEARRESPKKVQLPPEPVLAAEGGALEDHFRRTEKEMKRLIRRGHKWKETARKLEAENAKLRLLLEEAQKQNKRLDSALAKTGQSQQDIEHLLDLTPPKEPSIALPVRCSTTLHQPLHHKSSTSKARPSSLQHIPQQPHRNASKPCLPTRSASVSHPSPITALQCRIEDPLLPASETAARTNISVDRIPDIRKRLMAKNQARRAGLGVGKENCQGKGREGGEESGVDWVGI